VIFVSLIFNIAPGDRKKRFEMIGRELKAQTSLVRERVKNVDVYLEGIEVRTLRILREEITPVMKKAFHSLFEAIEREEGELMEAAIASLGRIYEYTAERAGHYWTMECFLYLYERVKMEREEENK